jgi:hypothetical protein
MQTGTGFLTVMVTVIALVFGRAAPAAPILSFNSVTVTADGTNPTLVQILVNVTNNASPITVSALTSQLTWTATGTGVGSLAVIEDSGSGSGSGFLFNGFSPLFDSQGSNTPPVGWGVSASGDATMATGTTSVALINLTVAAGVLNGVFDVNFATGGLLNNFTGGDPDYEPIPYANGNNGTTLGVITVVPEPTTTSILALCAVLVTGVGFAQRSARLRNCPAEIAG